MNRDRKRGRRRPAARVRLAALSAACALGAALAGCSAGETRYVDVDTKPTGAVIYVDGERRGLARATVRLDFADVRDRVLIQIVKPRYKPVLQYWSLGEVPESGKKVFVLEVD
ncbi:MAG: hypothetical protein ACUVYA_08075 [Planctomycetota bacterium]